MEHQNVTLSIPREILRRAKHIAVERGTSLSGLLTHLLEELTHREDAYRLAKRDHLAILEKYDLGTGGNIGWSRGELHERGR
ncbi:MAG TPA: CopG family transcriptional regulator [Desulfotomaculum sp.]|nr:CopG family transcriptional regulator [Desulfotomaculum sp.]